jgi:hypothetical protein
MLACEPPSLLEFSWDEATLRFELEPSGARTRRWSQKGGNAPRTSRAPSSPSSTRWPNGARRRGTVRDGTRAWISSPPSRRLQSAVDRAGALASGARRLRRGIRPRGGGDRPAGGARGTTKTRRAPGKAPIGPSSPANCGITGGADPAVRIPSRGDWEREANRRSQARSDSRQAASGAYFVRRLRTSRQNRCPRSLYVPRSIRRDGSGRASCKPVPGSGPQRPAPGAPGTRGRGGRHTTAGGAITAARTLGVSPDDSVRHGFRVQLFLVSLRQLVDISRDDAALSATSLVLVWLFRPRPGRRFAHARS